MKWRGKSLDGVNPIFRGKVAAAAKAAGATYIYVYSAKRTRANNTGVSNSNHLYGHALDGYAYIPGRGKVPLGTLVKDNAAQYGLRSGDQPGFYKGGPDPNHVDDGYNVNHGTPLSASTNVPQDTGQPDAGQSGQQGDSTQTSTDDPALDQSIAAIPQMDAPATADVALAGSFNSSPAQPNQGMGDTWRLIATNGDVSPDTQRLAALAGYAYGSPSG